MDHAPGAEGGEDRQHAAAYVADLTADLARIARFHGLQALAYLLDMARLEAQQVAGGGPPAGSPADPTSLTR